MTETISSSKFEVEPNQDSLGQQELNEELIQKLREMCKKSVFFLARAVLGFTDLSGDIHLPMCRLLEDSDDKRIIIVMPRTWFKSTIGSVAFPVWCAINDPNVRILIRQNTFSNAIKKLYAIKQIFEGNALFRALFPELLPDGTRKWSEDVLTVNRSAGHPEGTFEAAGTGTDITSRHYDIIIEDDTVSPEKAAMGTEMQVPTALEIEQAIGAHRLSTPLLVNQKTGRIIVIGTRWCDEDLIGWIMENQPNYKIVTRAVREKAFGVPATKEEGGVPAWPELFDEEVLEEVESSLGPYMFATLMMNYPTSSASQVFQRSWLRFYDSVDYKKLICCISIDPAAMGKGDDPDFDVVMTTGVDPRSNSVYVLDYARDRMSPGELINALLKQWDFYKPVAVYVEGVAYQRTLKYWIEQRQKQLGKFFAVTELPSTRSAKADVIKGLQPFFANGMVYMRTYMDVLQREIIAFPAPRGHDDVINALAFQIRFWNDTFRTERKARSRIYAEDPKLFDHVLGKLLNRNSARGYPYDMGLLRDRSDAPRRLERLN